MRLDCNGKTLDLSRPQVMGVLNVTPDSFSDGGEFFEPEKAIDRALQMQAEGAAIIDIGGESTRPGAEPVSVEDELQRVIPVIQAVHPHLEIPISIDTRKPAVMRAAIAAGAGMINDINALREKGAPETAAACGVPVCLMHMQGEPRTMQERPYYDDVLAEITRFLAQRISDCEQAGVPRSRILLDPGFGFGKSVDHNLRLLAGLGKLQTLGCPILVGLSRKSLIGKLIGVEVEHRLPASLALAVLAVERGAGLVRAHDVSATWQALQMVTAVRSALAQEVGG